MLIASKYEEIWAPEVKDYVYISDKAYTKEQILHMEKVMLNALRFHLTVPTPYNFLGRFHKASNDLQDSKVGLCTARLYVLLLLKSPSEQTAVKQLASLDHTLPACSVLDPAH